jgi:hypothetical protein
MCMLTDRIDLNVGYAFVNFINTQGLYTFAKSKLGACWDIDGSNKKLHMCYATYQ